MIRIGVLVWVTPPPGMSPEQVCREVRASVGFGRPEAQYLHTREYGDEAKGACGQCAPGYGHNNRTYDGPPDLHDGPWVNW